MATATEVVLKITQAAQNANRDLAWLAAIHVVLKSSQQQIPDAARLLLCWPERHLEVTPGLAPSEARKALRAFQRFGGFAEAPPTKDPGHYLNQSAILYADAILQAVLDNMYEPLAQAKGFPRVRLSKNTVEGTLSQISAEPIPGFESQLASAKHANFISALRHKITHTNGLVDDKFLMTDCKIDAATQRLMPGEKPLWDESIWPDEDAFLRSYRKDGPLDLAIERVIIPYLEHAISFVDEAKREFCEAAK